MANYDPERYWRIDDFVATDIIGSVPTYTMGEKSRIKLGFSPLPGESEDDYIDKIHEIRDRARYAGQYNCDMTVNSKMVYTESHHDGDTLLTTIRSPSSSRIDYDAWGLLDSVDVIQPPKNLQDAFRFTIDFLADFDDYPTKQAVENDLKSSGFH